jgi:hypothetical protein
LTSFFDQMAAGLAELADALDRAFSSATASRPSPEPILLGKAVEVTRWLQLKMQRWIEETGTTVVDVPVRVGLLCAGITFLHWIGADSLPAVGALGWLVRPRRENALTKKAPSPRKKKKGVGDSNPSASIRT